MSCRVFNKYIENTIIFKKILHSNDKISEIEATLIVPKIKFKKIFK